MKKKLLLCVIAGLILAGGFLMFGNQFKKPLYDADGKLKKDVKIEELLKIETEHGKLVSVSFSRGGSMNGETFYMSVFEEEGQLLFERSSSSQYSFPIRVWKYQTDTDALDQLRNYIDRYNLSVWKDLPFDEEMIALDGPSTSISMVFDDSKVGGSMREFCTISYDDVIPEGGYPILNDFVSLLSSFGKEEQFLETYLDVDGRKIYTGRQIENSEEEIELLLEGCWRSRDGQYTFYNYSMDYPYEFLPKDGEKIEYSIGQIIHEPYDDYDSSWYVEIKDEDHSAYLTVANGRLYRIEDTQIIEFDLQ